MKTLTEKQYYLIQAFLDGECNILQSLYVKYLVTFNNMAKGALEEMNNFNTRVRDNLSVATFESPDLWSKIANRIDQEERSAVFLGGRDFALAAEPAETRTSWWLFPSGVLAGAMTAAVLALVVGLPIDSKTGQFSGFNFQDSNQQLVSASSASNVTGASGISSVSSGAANNIPQFDVAQVSARSQSAKSGDPFLEFGLDDVEVDWMRSAGRLRIVPNEDEQVAAIIVQRPLRMHPSNSPSRIPQGIAVNNVVR